MNSHWGVQLSNLGISLFVGFLIWRYYRRRVFPPSEKYSTFGPRFWTGSIDSCVLWPFGFISSTLLALHLRPGWAALLVVVETLAWLLYTVFMHARYGMTVGKMVTKVRVVDFRTEGKISYRQSWLREGIPTALSLGILGYQIFGILSGKIPPRDVATAAPANGPGWFLTSLPFLWFIAEVLTMLTNEKRRALHDLIAGTVVIRTNIRESSPPENAEGAREVAPPKDDEWKCAACEEAVPDYLTTCWNCGVIRSTS